MSLSSSWSSCARPGGRSRATRWASAVCNSSRGGRRARQGRDRVQRKQLPNRTILRR
jgi:hypothetical protein